MAYTGNGTQADPYIVSTWEDFLAVCGILNAYVAFDPDAAHKVIDLNDTADSGGRGGFDIYANIEGNGWTIRNLVLTSGRIYSNNNVTVRNLHFQNFITYSDGFMEKVCCTGCQFSGILMATNCFAYQTGSYTTYLTNCSMNLRLMGKSGELFRRYCKMTNCDIRLSGSAASLALETSNGDGMVNCRFLGDVRLEGGTFTLGNVSSDANCVVAVHVTGTGTVAQSASATLSCIVDTEIIADTVTVQITGTNWHALTTAQMQDAAYLLDTVHFPVVVTTS